MQFRTRALVALLAAATAAPAFSQGYTPPPPPPEVPQGRDRGDSAQPAAQQSGLRPSKQALKAIVDLQTAVNSNNIPAIRAKAAEAMAVASTKEDRYLIGQLQLKVAVASKDPAIAASALDAISASGMVEPAKIAQLYSSFGVTAYNAKQHDQAAQLFERAVALDPRNTEALGFLGEARLAQGQKAQAIAAFQRAIQASGAKPPEPLLKRAVVAAYEARMPVAGELARQWVTNYPSQESWRNALAIYRNVMRPDAESTVDILRLMRATGAMTNASDYVLYANVLSEQSNFIEAQRALDQALAANRLNASDAQVRGLVSSLNSKPKTTAAELTAAAANAQSGMALLRIGDRFYGLGDYAKAADLYRQSMAKGVDPNLANMRIGVALAAAGDKAGATAAFNAVSGNRADVAKFWLLHLQSRA